MAKRKLSPPQQVEVKREGVLDLSHLKPCLRLRAADVEAGQGDDLPEDDIYLRTDLPVQEDSGEPNTDRHRCPRVAGHLGERDPQGRCHARELATTACAAMVQADGGRAVHRTAAQAATTLPRPRGVGSGRGKAVLGGV
eukprot:s3656_g5.t1